MASELWQRIRAARKHAGFTQEAFGALFDVSKAAVSQWEASRPENRTRPDLTKLQLISVHTGAPLNWLLDDAADVDAKWWGDIAAALQQPHQVGEPASAYGMEPILAWEHQDDLPEGEFVFIPRLDVHLSGGAGREQIEIDLVKENPQAFRTEWIRLMHLKPNKLAAMRATGESMEPTIHAGDSLLIDTSQTEVVDGKVYALWYDGGERVKRLFRLPGGGLRIKSDNPAFSPIDLGPDYAGHVRVIGRVVHRSGVGGL